ncbi:MAG: metal ABC transporter substrate-binding protein [Verrucomicrobiota bacterium]
MNIKNLLTVLSLTLVLTTAQAKLKVVATTADLGAIAKSIGGDQIELSILGRPTEDPHFVDAKPSFILKLNRADLVIEGGAELEVGWLPTLIDQARNQKIADGAPGHVSCARGVQLLEIPTTLDRSKGDIHAAGNPHYVIDPENAKIVAQNIATALIAADAKSAGTFQANLNQFTGTLDRKIAEWQKTLAPFAGQHLVAYHNSWLYFGTRFGLKIDVFLEPKPGVPPTPSHLAEVITQMKADKIHVLIVDPYLNRRTAESVAAKTGGTVVDVSQFPGGIKGTEEDYVKLLDYVVTALAKALAQNP